jgi:hypothetical protein
MPGGNETGQKAMFSRIANLRPDSGLGSMARAQFGKGFSWIAEKRRRQEKEQFGNFHLE